MFYIFLFCYTLMLLHKLQEYLTEQNSLYVNNYLFNIFIKLGYKILKELNSYISEIL